MPCVTLSAKIDVFNPRSDIASNDKNSMEQPYLDLLRHLLDHGTEKSDRTGTGTRSVFGWQMRFDLRQGFPLLTTKKVHWRSVVSELLWFIRGDTNVRWLQQQGLEAGSFPTEYGDDDDAA